MKAFLALFTALDESNSTRVKQAALRDYFAQTPPESAAWALFFLSGRKMPSLVKPRLLREWIAQISGLPDWMVAECYERVGDLAETLALLHPDTGLASGQDLPLDVFINEHLLPLKDWDDTVKFQLVREAWARLEAPARFLFNKLITGGFRVGVSRRLVVRALAELAGLPPAVMEHRLMGDWQPSAAGFTRLLEADEHQDPARPYPFFLASPLEQPVAGLGDPSAWRVEWKWDGIRAQLIRRRGHVLLWSRGEDMLGERFPEITSAAARLPDGCVLDGEVLCWQDGAPLPFARLQTRITRTKLNPSVIQQAPAAFIAYDCLEKEGQDLRELPLSERLDRLQTLLAGTAGPPLLLPPALTAKTWSERARLREESRQRGVEGIMIKKLDSPYRTGRVRGDWWKWKTDPYSIDAVLINAQAGHGRRAGLYTDYTFAVHHAGELVPFAKAYSGLTLDEIKQLDTWIKAHTTGRRGPIRFLEPYHVFEIHFEGIATSNRHRSGLAVRFPRIARWRRDKKIGDADTLDTLRALMKAE